MNALLSHPGLCFFCVLRGWTAPRSSSRQEGPCLWVCLREQEERSNENPHLGFSSLSPSPPRGPADGKIEVPHRSHLSPARALGACATEQIGSWRSLDLKRRGKGKTGENKIKVCWKNDWVDTGTISGRCRDYD